MNKRAISIPVAKDGENDFSRTAMRVSAISILCNLLLFLFKLLAGIFARSEAMLSDAVHSASDVFSTFVVIVGVRLAGKAADAEHPYGHERLECVASIVLAAILAATGLAIGYSACATLADGQWQEIAVPGIWALVAAVVSVAAKEAMYWYTKINAQRIDSGALMADAWHHRSDALSSIGAFIGIAGARLGFPALDAIASIVICLCILKAAYDIFKDAMDKMIDKSCDATTEKQLLECALAQEGVLGVDFLRTRIFGNKIYVDIEIRADGDRTLWETHAIAEQVHGAIEEQFEKVKHIMVHVNPS